MQQVEGATAGSPGIDPQIIRETGNRVAEKGETRRSLPPMTRAGRRRCPRF